MKQKLALALALLLFAVPAVAQEQWNRFRGPNGQGISQETGLPTTWSPTENVAWKTAIPGESWSSPVIWNDHIFLTTATEGGRNCHVIAIDRRSGRILWNRLVFTQEAGHRHPENSYATPTPTTDGETVFAAFWGGCFVALDFAGNVRWTNRDLNFYSQHGMATSPILYNDLVILSADQSHRGPDMGQRAYGWHRAWDGGFLLALDKRTGEQRWRASRGMSRLAHATPVIIQVNGRDQILSIGGDVIQGFNPTNGDLIWTVQSSGEPAVPTPAIGDGLVFGSTVGPITAIRPNGQGDVTNTHVAWQQRQNIPLVSSFLYVKPVLYTANRNGTFAAHDEATGEILWQVRLEGGRPDSSPIYADGHIYISTFEGMTTVLRLNENPRLAAEVIAVNDIGTTILATPAIANGQIFIRTANELWAIGTAR